MEGLTADVSSFTLCVLWLPSVSACSGASLLGMRLRHLQAWCHCNVGHIVCLQVRVEIADLTNTCQHSRQGKRVGVELQPLQGGSGKLRLVLELQKQARMCSSNSVHTKLPGSASAVAGNNKARAGQATQQLCLRPVTECLAGRQSAAYKVKMV